MEWKLAEAKKRLSELVAKATTEGPQTIRWHDGAVVIISESSYRALTGEHPTFKQLLLTAPSFEGLIPERDHSSMREAEL
jgi:antitoxin Phd